MKSPRVISVDCNMPISASVIAEAVTALAEGELIIMPTETVYGIAADARNPEAEKKLFQAKMRSRSKPIPLLSYDCAQIEEWGADFGCAERFLAKRYWPGPLTLLLSVKQNSEKVDCEASARDSDASCERTVVEGFRIPDHPVPLAVLKSVGSPLRATSANIAGESPALTAESAVKALGESVKLVLDGGPVSGGVASTVVRFYRGSLQILREGPISIEQITNECQKNSFI